MSQHIKRSQGPWGTFWQIFKEEDLISQGTLIAPVVIFVTAVVLLFLYQFYGFKLGHLLGIE